MKEIEQVEDKPKRTKALIDSQNNCPVRKETQE